MPPIPNLQEIAEAVAEWLGIATYVHRHATGGTGTEADPWIGWEAIPWAPFTTYRFRKGWFRSNACPDWALHGIRLEGDGGANLQFTNAGPALSIGIQAQHKYAIAIHGLKIIGNANTTYGILLQSLVHMDVENVAVVNAKLAGWRLDNVISSTFRNVRCSTNENVFTTLPVDGMQVDGVSNANSIFHCSFEGVTAGAGLRFQLADGNLVSQGVSEGNKFGVVITEKTESLIIDGTYFEANSAEDILSSGAWIQLRNVRAAQGRVHFTHSIPGARLNSSVVGGRIDKILIDANAGFVSLYGPIRFNDSGTGSLIDLSTSTTIIGPIVNCNPVPGQAPVATTFHDHLAIAQCGGGPTNGGASGAVNQGIGTGGTCVHQAGATDTTLRVTLTPGNRPGSTGTVFIGFAKPFKIAPKIFPALEDGTGSWAVGASVRASKVTTSGYQLEWSNGGAALKAAQTYRLNVWVIE